MTNDPLLQEKAFSFIRVAPRPSKPREDGLTIVADRGMSIRKVEDLMETAGDYVDIVKIAIGAYRLQTEDFLRRKINLLHENGVMVFFAGDVTETAYAQGVSKQFYEGVKALDADAVEVSSAQVSMSLDDKCGLIRMAGKAGLKVIAEVGQKGHEVWTHNMNYVYTQMEAFRKAGAWRVLIQGEGISEGVEKIKGDLILDIAARFDIKDLIFQAKDGPTQSWYLESLGNAVNLDVDDNHVIDVELLRRGIRKRGLFGLISSLQRE